MKPVKIGIIGGGQLGKMIAQEAKRMSFEVYIMDPNPNCPASSVSDGLIVSDFKDEESIKKLASKTDILTYEIELANSVALKDLEKDNFPIHPSPDTLRIIQNKLSQKTFLKKNNIPTTEFKKITSKHDLVEFISENQYPVMLKASLDSYDGRGNYLISSEDEINSGLKFFQDKEIFVEKFVHFKKEISVMVARNHDGEIETFPVVENVHVNNILDTTFAPAKISEIASANASKIAKLTMSVLKGSGIFGIEMFLIDNDQVLINEIAPRPHNSGHYSIEACSISQFEQHIRSVLNLPLVSPELLTPAVMMNILGPETFSGSYEILGFKDALSIPGVKIHIYGKKTTSPRRKLGHLTATGKTIEIALARAKQARELIKIAVIV